MDTILARIDAAVDQQWDVPVFSSQGHNDALMTTDPDLNATILDKWKRNLDAWIGGHPNALLIPVCGTLPSNVAGETTASSFNPAISRRQRVYDLQEEYVAAKADDRLVYIDLSSWDPTTGADDTGDVHPNNAGGKSAADLIFAVIDPLVDSATKDEVADLFRLGTYPGLSGSNIHPDVLLAGTTGTKAGTPAPTGEYATGQRLTSNLTNGAGISLVASKDTSPDPYDKQIVTINGTSAAENTVVMDDTGNITIPGATKGQYAVFAEEVIVDDGSGGAPDALWRILLATGSYGSTGGNQASDSATGAPIDYPIDAWFISAPKAIFGSGTLSANPGLTLRFDDIAMVNNRMVISRPCLYLLSTPNQSPAAYIGGDTIVGTNYQIRASGTISDASGGTLTLEPGQWAPYGLTFGNKRVYKGGTAGGADGQSGLGSGALLYTISAAGTWTQAVAAADVVAGDLLYVEIDAQSSVGGVATARSNTAVTVGA